ncbi:cupin domain-containing protein [Aliiruegeria lutimaris]|uniref:Anti-ECFsigma factor, ChrR n=1 Tax=Aliiruegeria lutimaris TaxID=571298 RepID=A0A1G8RMM9_9RHOB|nr:cupin domain-containing protein [Aliiruegeria lutimaris]SDJ18142.1 anti-ECFsigma factor, ChrR [Aliiruegeria lutimaris]
MDKRLKPLRYVAGMIQGGWHDLAFGPFREGVKIAELIESYPKLALLRYAPGASVPRHLHTGLETILVLEGSQTDEAGHYPTGSLMINPAGTSHAVWSEEGCVVLIQWERPVEMIEEKES